MRFADIKSKTDITNKKTPTKIDQGNGIIIGGIESKKQILPAIILII